MNTLVDEIAIRERKGFLDHVTSILPSPPIPWEEWEGQFYYDGRHRENRGRLREVMESDEFFDWMRCEESRMLVLRARDHIDYRCLSAAIRDLVNRKPAIGPLQDASSAIYHDMCGKNEHGPVVSQIIPFVLSWDISYLQGHKEEVNEALEIFENPDVAQNEKWTTIWDLAKVILNEWSELNPRKPTYIVLGRVAQNLTASSHPPDDLCSEGLQQLIFYMARMIQGTSNIKVWLLIWDNSSSTKTLEEIPGPHNSIIKDIGDQFKEMTCGIDWAARSS